MMKRRYNGKGQKPGKVKAARENVDLSWRDEEISSSEDEDDDTNNFARSKAATTATDENGDEDETIEQKRKRLAKAYLKSVAKSAVIDDRDDDDSDGAGENESVDDLHLDGTSRLLREQRLLKQGKYFRSVSSRISGADLSCFDEVTVLGSHQLSTTCVALSSSGEKVFSGSKDNSVAQWDVETGKRTFLKPFWSRKDCGSTQASAGETLAVAVTSDGKYVVSGGRDNIVRVYDVRQRYAEIKAFSGHRDAVTSLSFRKDTYSLFSGSMDRCVKYWDLNEMGYLETLFGHQDTVLSIDCWTKARPITGSSDRSARIWKIAEESHLVYRGPKASLDCVQLLGEETFLSGGQDGALSLWKESQKKPIASVPAAHGYDGSTMATPRWITSMASVKMSDFCVSGSFDGQLRLWSVDSEERAVQQVGAVPMAGFVNAIDIQQTRTPSLLAAGLGREHRLGRWWNMPASTGAGNKVVIWRLPTGGVNATLDGDSSDDDEDDDDDDDDDLEDESEEPRDADEDFDSASASSMES
jgi:ribosomal RNA-processing protein 9